MARRTQARGLLKLFADGFCHSKSVSFSGVFAFLVASLRLSWGASSPRFCTPALDEK